MKIQKRKFAFELVSLDDVAGVSIYYGDPPLDYESTKIAMSIVDIENKIDLENVVELTLPDDVPVGEGLQAIGVSTFDDNGHESDIAQIEYFFDFTPPMMPKNLRIL